MYAVFGVTESIAREKAYREVIDHQDLDKLTHNLTELTGIYFKSMNPTKLSPIYSNYSEAKQYLDLATKSGRDLEIKVGNDFHYTNKGRHVIEWSTASQFKDMYESIKFYHRDNSTC